MVAFREVYFTQYPFDPFSALVSPAVKHLRHIREHNVVTQRVQNLFPFVQDLIAILSVLVLIMASVRVHFSERLFRLGSRFTSWPLFHSKKTAKASARLYKGKESALHCMHKLSRHFVCLSLTCLRWSCTFSQIQDGRRSVHHRFSPCAPRQPLILACLPLYIEMGENVRWLGTFGHDLLTLAGGVCEQRYRFFFCIGSI